MKEGKKYSQEDHREEDHNTWLFLFIVLVLFFFAFFVYNFGWNTGKQKETQPFIERGQEIMKPENEILKKNALPPVDQEELKSEYMAKIEEIIKLYKEIKEKDNQEDWAKFSNKTLDELFKAVVPAQYKDFHLNLVISFNLINQGASIEDKAENLEKGIKKADEVIGGWE